VEMSLQVFLYVLVGDVSYSVREVNL